MTPPAIPPQLRSGPFTVAEAQGAGLTWRQLQGTKWRRVGPGQYAWNAIRDTPLLRMRAVRDRLPQGGAFSGRSAGWLHGLDLPPCNPIEVTVQEGGGVSGRSGVSVFREVLSTADIVERQALPVTSAIRTVCDLARRLPLTDAVAAVDMALHQRLVDLAELNSAVAARQGSKGVVRLRLVVGLAEPGSESRMETRFRLILVRAGLPRPEVQAALIDQRGEPIGRADLYYASHRLVLEYDGAVHRDKLVEDSRRQNLLVSAGYRILRFSAADVLRNPDGIIKQVRAALRDA